MNRRGSLFQKTSRWMTTCVAVACLGGTLSLQGCGFQLRGMSGNTQMKVQQIDLVMADDTPQSGLARNLRARLSSAGVAQSSAAEYRLNVAAPRYVETTIGYNSSSNREREITLTVPYTLQRTSDGAYVSMQESIQSRGTYQTNDHQLLQRDDQQARVRDNITDDAAAQLVERLRALGETTTPHS